jgi:hypothetical protein
MFKKLLELFKLEISIPLLTGELLLILQMGKTNFLFTCNLKVTEKYFIEAFGYSTRNIQLMDDDGGSGGDGGCSSSSITS